MLKQTVRKDGYYWVKFTEVSEWSIAEMLGGYWYFPRQVSAKYDGDFYELDPTPITRTP